MNSFCIVKTHPRLVAYVDHLQRKNAEALSFYPRVTFEREAEKGRIYLGLLNGEPCGYIYTGASRATTRCHQVCIQYDARRRLYGAQLVVAMEDEAKASGSTGVSLRCGFDLDANEFWSSLGYVCIAQVPGGVRRMRTINVWRKQIGAELFSDLAIDPARGTTDARLWRRHKSTGIVTQFHRGKALKDYRALLVSGEGE